LDWLFPDVLYFLHVHLRAAITTQTCAKRERKTQRKRERETERGREEEMKRTRKGNDTSGAMYTTRLRLP